MNSKILWDADWLVNLEEEFDSKDKEKLEKAVSNVFLTATGKKIAREKYLK